MTRLHGRVNHVQHGCGTAGPTAVSCCRICRSGTFRLRCLHHGTDAITACQHDIGVDVRGIMSQCHSLRDQRRDLLSTH